MGNKPTNEYEEPKIILLVICSLIIHIYSDYLNYLVYFRI